MKLTVTLSLCCILFVGCAPSANLQPDSILLDQSKNVFGERPVTLEDIVQAPKDKPFRIQEVENLEKLVESLQVSRQEIREAIFTGPSETPLLKDPNSKSLKLGQVVKSKDQIQVFWPTDVVNDFIKVKTKDGEAAWLKYKNSKFQPQVVLLEDFIIPQVLIRDSRMVVILDEKEKDDERTVVVISDEVVKKITHETETPSVTAKKPDEVDLTPDKDSIEIDLQTDTTSTPTVALEEPSTLAPEKSIRPVARPQHDVAIDPNSDAGDVVEVPAEEHSDLAPEKSIRPKARPSDLNTSKPPLMTASGMTAEELLTALGIEPVKISAKESEYISIGRRKITEVFPRGHKTFSACTFNPAQGSAKNNCYRELVLSKEFTDFLGDEGMSCANDAAKQVFGSSPLKVLLKTNGGSVNRGSTTSLHDRGRALDIFKLFLYFDKAVAPKEIGFHKNSTDGSSASERRNHSFYWAFEKCWTAKIQRHHKTKACGSTGSGALTYKYNKLHYDHMHISLPVCKDLKLQHKLKGT